jgi:glyoxalase family protein
MKAKGIHHISTIVRHAQENVDFYAGVLGLRLIKRTLNFDDHNVYHLYYGNHAGDLGTAITFFPWPKTYKDGKIGDGQVAITTYTIPVGSLNFWKERLFAFKINFTESIRLGQKFLSFKDPHGITNELIESDEGIENLFEFNGVTKENAIKGFFGAVLYSTNYEKTVRHFVDDLGFSVILEDSDYIRLDTDREVARYIDIYKQKTSLGSIGAGSVHHIAFGVEEKDMENWKKELSNKGYYITGIKDRKFFKSLYYREPGGVTIELASFTPGFEVDEPYQEAPDLFMPPHYEDLRDEVESKMYPLFVRPIEKLTEYPYENKTEYLHWKSHQELLAKINYYAKESKLRSLTEAEIEERAKLRQEYVKRIRGAIEDNLESIQIEDKDGNYQELKKKEGKVQ